MPHEGQIDLDTRKTTVSNLLTIHVLVRFCDICVWQGLCNHKQ